MRTFVTASLLAAILGAPAGAAELVASAAFANELYRVDTMTGDVTSIGTYQLASPNETILSVLARRPNGALIGLSDSNLVGRVYRIDEATAQITPIHAVQSAPVAAQGGSVDPTDGSFYFNNTFGFVPFASLQRIDLATGGEAFLGNIAPIGESFQGLAFDDTGTLYALNLTQNRLWRVAKTDATQSAGVGAGLGGVDVSAGGSLAFDETVGVMYGYEVKGKRLFTVDLQTGIATPLPGTGGLAPEFVDVAPDDCDAAVTQYGTGCPGSGGFVPTLALGGCAEAGGTVSVQIEQGLGGAPALLLVGTAPASIPAGACTLLVALPVALAVPLNLSGAGPGNGTLSFDATVPAIASGATFTLQVFVFDPAPPLGASATNGIKGEVP